MNLVQRFTQPFSRLSLGAIVRLGLFVVSVSASPLVCAQGPASMVVLQPTVFSAQRLTPTNNPGDNGRNAGLINVGFDPDTMSASHAAFAHRDGMLHRLARMDPEAQAAMGRIDRSYQDTCLWMGTLVLGLLMGGATLSWLFSLSLTPLDVVQAPSQARAAFAMVAGQRGRAVASSSEVYAWTPCMVAWAGDTVNDGFNAAWSALMAPETDSKTIEHDVAQALQRFDPRTVRNAALVLQATASSMLQDPSTHGIMSLDQS